MATHPSIPAWRIHGRRRLVGYRPRGHKSQNWENDQGQGQALHNDRVGSPGHTASLTMKHRNQNQKEKLGIPV